MKTLVNNSLFSSKDLPDDWNNTIREFKVMFDHLYNLQVLSETPKIHILYCHLEQYILIQSQTDKKSLALSDCQGLEACHSGLRKSDRRHNCDIKHHQVHKLMSVSFTVFFPFFFITLFPDSSFSDKIFSSFLYLNAFCSFQVYWLFQWMLRTSSSSSFSSSFSFLTMTQEK